MNKADGINASGLPLCKVTFYKKIERGDGNKLGELTLPYDPKSLNVTHQNCLKDSKAIGSESGSARYQKSPPSVLTITFLLDNTIIETPSQYAMTMSGETSTEDSIQEMLKYGLAVQGETHLPAFVTIMPLNMVLNHGADGGFHGMFSDINVITELVNSKGNRVKAQVVCNISECLSSKEIKLRTGKSSPDLTHELQFMDGDSLVSKVTSIYGKANYVHQVASVNRMPSIRSASVGEYITYPPLER
ncbi:hypothetical protein [Pseudoalteromonas luteoviolacea]|uniref:Contractile injection system tube protein N-terminal domain-containing protein n=1 Tax=Pseudoalteromonas luteoviolacea S4054 TaxID=1129367 RepID=A0A0F6ABB4_9GAMM|nr:hypothetical protein [Pseudoalteromonas luteoviolacea]AOT08507.1 hypothetical protein S4054249_11905 [Pseudoalteromonas luteoviolacea]AOT13423.1 hypothetical protein S40542_11880 [Pseudoalteromonas luteoviolacea]AOT18336.1 hypothetical protein S4054_11880 [Pseudoalteromonas luteoviolacea]KKE83497.1 hypothetical protein N479_14085 [Pseudoalteromonas luteoviolacea S4054]KZN75934.1 hypothetical protein N481_06180 [Pseudoalteromonas luteoviolacea S4047-1]